MNRNHLLLILYISILELLSFTKGQAQPPLDVSAFSAMSPAQRYRFIHDCPLGTADSASFWSLYNPMLQIALDKKDRHAVWLLRFYYFFKHEVLGMSEVEMFSLLTELETSAKTSNFKVELLVAQYYMQFQKYKHDKSSYEQNYAQLLRQFDAMDAVGFDKFKDYSITIVMFQGGEFMYDLEDFEKALQFLKVAERFIEPTENGYHFYVLILNYIQTIYQKQEKYDQGIVYAQKILDFTQSFKTNDVKIQQFCQLWQGFTSIDMATILLRQKKMTEGEHFADAGYMQISQLANSEPTFESAKYEALKALTGTKLEMGRLDEVESFLKQMEAMGKKEGATPSSYFKHLSMYQFYAKLYELKGDYAKAVRYNNLVKPLEDSLRRRNDVRKLEKIQKRLDAEKYNTKLTLVENEKQDLRRLRNLSFGFLLLVLVLAYVIYRRIQTKRQTAITALAAAEQNLESVNNSVLETAQKVDMLNLEIEKLEYSDVRNGYLEQLLNSTILTEDDWAKFRHLFEKIYPDFIDQQKTLYPDLTPAETRLVVLDKLGINLQEMANMLGVSKNAIHQTRYRLRRKLGDVL